MAISQLLAHQQPNESPKDRATESLLLLLQVTPEPILLQIGRHRSAHKVWDYLRKTYYKGTPLYLTNEIYAFYIISSILDPSPTAQLVIDPAIYRSQSRLR